MRYSQGTSAARRITIAGNAAAGAAVLSLFNFASAVAAAANSNASSSDSLLSSSHPLAASFNISDVSVAADDIIAGHSDNYINNLCRFSTRARAEPFSRWEMALQPYWLVFLSCLFLTLLSYSWNWVLVRTHIGRTLTRLCYATMGYAGCIVGGGRDGLAAQDSESGLQTQHSAPNLHARKVMQASGHGRARDKVDAILRDHAALISNALADGAVRFTLEPAPSFMALQLVLQFGHAIYCVCTLHGDQGGWEQYEELYSRILNGGGAALLLPVFYASVAASRSRSSLPFGYAYALNFYFVMLLPILLTHGPMLYIFLHLLVLMLLVACVGFSPRLLGASINLLGPKIILVLAVAANTFAAFMLQSAVFSGVMFYSGTHYLQTIANEYELRDTRCYTRVIEARVQHMLASLVSLV